MSQKRRGAIAHETCWRIQIQHLVICLCWPAQDHGRNGGVAMYSRVAFAGVVHTSSSVTGGVGCVALSMLVPPIIGKRFAALGIWMRSGVVTVCAQRENSARWD
jgi:hypothetical protein